MVGAALALSLRRVQRLVPAGGRRYPLTDAADTGSAVVVVHDGVGLAVAWVNPAHEHSWAGPAKRCTSPISATNTAASTGPMLLGAPNEPSAWSNLTLSRRHICDQVVRLPCP